MAKGERVYTVTAELRVLVKPKSMIAEGNEAVAAAVRHRLRLSLPEAWTGNGLRFDHGYIDVEIAQVIKQEAAE
jgi:hypothetical protein